MLNGEVVSPPAGAIGRGDAFVLRIAERTGAVVLSNDSFQEFHGQHPWLFDDGRLIGGKPVPGVGWIFTPRLPIRGPKSRAATAETRAARDPESAPAKAAELARAAKKAAKHSTKKAPAPVVEMTWPITPSEPPPSRRGRRPAPVDDPELSSAISEAVAEAIDPPTEVTMAKVPAKKKAVAAKKDAAPKKAAKKAAGAKKAESPKKAAAKKSTAKKAPAKKAPAKAEKAEKAEKAAKKAPAKKAAPEMKPAAAKRPTAKKSADLVVPDGSGPRRRSATPPPAVNEPLSFITFVATYPLRSTVEGEVVSFTSHGAMVDVALPDGGSLHCYIPLSAMGDPPPTKARQVLTKGAVRPFVLSSLDPPRRVAELSLPETDAKKRRGTAKKAAGAAR
jgi:hypothetical protein